MNRKQGTAIGAGLLLVAAGAASGRAWTASHQQAQGLRVITMDASWAKEYKSVGELKKDSSVAVAGTFGKVKRQDGDPKGLLSRDYAFTVAKVAYAKPGVGVTVGQVITIHQTGGVAGGVEQQIADDPLFQDGETAALFLVQDSPGAFHVVGGPGGRFKVDQANTVTPFNDETAQFTGTVPELATQLTAP
jgi:hypothetical protein